MTTNLLSATLSAFGRTATLFVPHGPSELTMSAYDSLGLPQPLASAWARRLQDWRSFMPRPSRTTASTAELAALMTPREQQAIAMLATVHAATTSQVARTVFTGSPSAERLARRTLQRLMTAGLVRRFPDRSRDRKVGAKGYIHALTAAGLRHGGGHRSLGLRQRRSWRPSTQFLAHRLGVSELYVRLVEQQHLGGAVVREFRAEPDCWRVYTGPAGARLVLRPDALVRLEVGRLEVSWFVEIDLDTEKRASTIAAKCQAYLRYEASGQEQRPHGVFPGVLFVVPDDAREAVIRRTIAHQSLSAQSLFAVARQDEAVAALIDSEVAA